MGTDIHMYMECHSRKKKQYTYHGKLEGYRLYGLFGIMSDVFTDEEPLYYSRGLPGDVTNQVYRAYKDEGGDAHHASWLNTEEFRKCLDVANERFAKDAPEDWLKQYELVYSYLKDSDDEGEPARIVFWFDN